VIACSLYLVILKVYNGKIAESEVCKIREILPYQEFGYTVEPAYKDVLIRNLSE
jgi:hypothetical protein